jgi:hypothetical protein
MLEEYSKEELWKIYEKLPPELKGAIFSEETANFIYEICSRNNIDEGEKISEIARYTGRTLLGLLPPEKLNEVLEKDLGLGKEVAKKISQEINHLILYPVKASLEALYKIEINPPAKPTRISSSLSEEKEVEEKPKAPKIKKGPDVYREPVE